MYIPQKSKRVTLGLGKMASRFIPLLVLLLLPVPAFAYLDPGTGSLLVQGLIAAIAGGLMFVRGKWLFVKDLFGRLFRKGRDENS